MIFTFLAAIALEAQVEDNIYREGSQTPTDRVFKLEKERKRNQPGSETDGVPFSEVIRETEPPYTDSFRDLTIGGRSVAKMGSQGGLSFHTDFHDSVRLRTPFTEGIRPEEAELKFRNFYLDVLALSGELLYSDNIHRDNSRREDGFIALTRLNFGMMYQLGDNLKISTKAAILYLPQRNKVGLAGLSLAEPFLEAALAPLGSMQLSYNIDLGEWTIELLEEVLVRQRAFGSGLTYDFMEGETFDEQDVAGRYRTETVSESFSGSGQRSRETDFGDNVIVIENTVGARAERLLPTVTRMSVGAFHRNMWYKGNNSTSLPSSQDSAFINLVSERESMRFKPFAGYRVYKYDTHDDWSQVFRAGVRGPITDYIFFLSDVGFHEDMNNRARLIWRARLDHNPNPYLLHRIEYSREVTDPIQQLETGITYRIRYRINENWYAEGFTSLMEVEDLQTNSPRTDELRSGLRFTGNLSPSLTVSLAGYYTQFGFEKPVQREYERWTGRARLLYSISSSLNVNLTYQYETYTTVGFSDSYGENLILAEVTKYF